MVFGTEMRRRLKTGALNVKAFTIKDDYENLGAELLRLAWEGEGHQKEMREREVAVMIQRERAISSGRTKGSKQPLTSTPINVGMSPQRLEIELWREALEEWRRCIERGKKACKILRDMIQCQRKLHDVGVKGLRLERGEADGMGWKEFNQLWRIYEEDMIETRRDVIVHDETLFESEKRFMACERDFWERDMELAQAEGMSWGQWEREWCSWERMAKRREKRL
jgi:hypothetical protein